MAHHELDSTTMSEVMRVLSENGLEHVGSALEILLNAAMRLERDAFLSAKPYERTEQRRGHANGFKAKQLLTRCGRLDLAVPQTRGLEPGAEPFYPAALERGVRSERALKVAIAEMYVQGVSTRKVMAITEELCGFEVSSSQVSRAAKGLDDELEAWRCRPIGEIRYLILDARYEKVRIDGAVRDVAVLIAIGVGPDGRRRVLGVSVSLSEAEVHWRQFLASLNARGLRGVRLVVSDDHAGLKAARKAELAGVPWQRCQFHLQQNVVAYVPHVAMRKEVAAALRSIFTAPDRAEADRRLKTIVAGYAERYPKLADWIDASVAEGLTIFAFPEAHRRLLRTSNLLEALNKEIKRRTRVATLFPNEASLLRLVSAVLVEISDDWETGRIYAAMDEK
jgi:transposase-like protein